MPSSDLNFGDLMEAVAGAVPDRTAIVYGPLRRSWRELDERSNRLARFLLDAGLKTDSKVAFYLRNTPAYIELMLACFKARLVHCNVNYRYLGPELKHVMENSDAEVVAFDEEFLPHADRLRSELPLVSTWLQVGGDAPGFASAFEAACSDGDGSPLGNDRSPNDLYFMYTGGTTGYPKGVMWRHGDRIAVIGMSDARAAEEHAARVAAEGRGPTLLTGAPFMHSTGFTSAISTLIAGGCIVIPEAQRFDAEATLDAIERERVTRFAIVGDAFAVPLLETLRNSGRSWDLGSVELISSAGAMWSQPAKEGLLEFFTDATLSDSLGSSEGSRLAGSVSRRGDTAATAHFVPGPNVKVFDEEGVEVEPGSGRAGRIATWGALPQGYYKDPEGTARTFPVIDGVRYSMPGDWCRVEADGSLTLLGRGSNCINSGGEKIYPEEVEEALKALPEIRDAAVFGTSNERFGQQVTALVVPEAGATVTLADVREQLSEVLAGYKHPRALRVTEQSLRHENGKMNYRGVLRLFETSQAV